MSEVSALQSKILYHLSSSGEAQVAMDVLQHKLNERSDLVSAAIRGLLETRRVAIRQSSDAAAGGAPRIFVSLAHGDMSENFALVYDAIRAAGTSGIDQQQLAARLRIPKSDILKALRSLTQTQKIQEQRSFTNRAKKVYLLFHLQPSAQVTGGTLYCGEDLDVALVDELRQRIVSYVSRHRSVGLRQVERFIEEQTTGAAPSSSSTSFAATERVGKLESAPVDDAHAFALGGAVKQERMTDGFGDPVEDDFAMGAVATRGSARGWQSHDADADADDEQRPGSPIAFIHSSGGSLSGSQHQPPSPSPGLPQRSAMMADRSFPSSAAAAPPPSVSITTKRIQAKDVRALLQTLVLDGVIEELLGPFHSYYAISSNTDSLYASALGHTEPRYQLATGGNVMRHFTATPLPRRGGLTAGAAPTATAPAEGTSGSTGGTSQGSAAKRGREDAAEAEVGEARARVAAGERHLAALQRAMASEAVWGPADIARPSSLFPSSSSSSAPGASWAYMPAIGFPCLGCPQLAHCSASGTGVVNQKDCAYLAEWLR